jgi:hypothetical protein
VVSIKAATTSQTEFFLGSEMSGDFPVNVVFILNFYMSFFIIFEPKKLLAQPDYLQALKYMV